MNSFTTFQPVTVMFPPTTFSGLNSYPNIIVSATNSNFMVQAVINNLADNLNIDLVRSIVIDFIRILTFECEFSYFQNGFTPIFNTYFSYFSTVTPQSVSVHHPDVSAWYNRTKRCFQEYYDLAESTDGGGFFFMQQISNCYRQYAYIYYSTTEVMNVRTNTHTKINIAHKV